MWHTYCTTLLNCIRHIYISGDIFEEDVNHFGPQAYKSILTNLKKGKALFAL